MAKRKKRAITAPTTIPNHKHEARYYRMFNTLLVTLNGEISQSIRLRRALKRYNDALRRGGLPAANILQSALLAAMASGERKAAKIAPEMAEKAIEPTAKQNEIVWTKALRSQLGAAMSVRLMEKTRVSASKELIERRAKQVHLINDWTTAHYTNFQNNWNAAIRRAENTGKPVNLMEVARKSIEAGQVPPNDKIRNRARLIARDQLSKTASALDRKRARQLGADFYQWRSVSDSRVRPDHREYHGKYFRKDGKQVDQNGKLIPGALATQDGEQPGDAVQCRCVAAWKLPI